MNKSPTLDSYRENIYSQNGEDGILEEILKRLDISSGWFCEFGAWDGTHLSNTRHLLEQGWSGVMIEGDEEKFEDLQKTGENFTETLFTVNEFVSTKNKGKRLDEILDNTPIPIDFDVLSVDVDGPDYFIWRDLEKYNPKIVVIEVESSIPPPIRFVRDKHPNSKRCGASFEAMVELGKIKGYSAVAHTGNVIFVRDDLVDELQIPEKEINNTSFLFREKWAKKHSETIFTERSISENIEKSYQILNQRGVIRGVYYITRRIVHDVKNADDIKHTREYIDE